MKKKILITGGLGYLGTELCKLYSGISWYNDITVVDNRFLSERVSQLSNWNIKFFQGDVTNENFLKKLVYDADVIIHLAGITDVAYLKKDSDPIKDAAIERVAIQGTNNILKYMKKESKIIFPSTHVVFDGLSEMKKNLTEKDIPKPQLAYSKSKYQNEIDIINSNKKYIILRLGSVYGYSLDSSRIGIMPNLFSKIASQNGTLHLYSGGKQLKSLVPLIDVVRCFKFMAENESLENEIFHLVKDNVTVKDVANLCKDINPNLKIIETLDEIPNLGYTLSNKKLLKTGFKFLYDLRTSLFEMINNWKNKLKGETLEYTRTGEKEFIDERGKISNYELSEPINLIGYIESKKHTVRANHFHPVQEQKCLIIKGQFISVIKNLLDTKENIETRIVNAGDIVVTKPNVAHAMLFTEDTIFLNLVRGEREHKNYGITHTIPYVTIDDNFKKDLIRNYQLSCRSCKGNRLKQFISLGKQPLANNLINNTEQKYDTYLLELNYCLDCYNVQLTYNVDPKKMFKKYFYLSSTSKQFQEHFKDACYNYVKRFNLKKNDNILDIGSNDGIGLKPFLNLGFKKLFGIEPASNLAKITNKIGIKTYNEFLNLRLVKKINKKFKIILASNVFAHSPNLEEMCLSLKKILEKEGIFIIEVQYLLDTLKDLTFDNIYHEHYNYWCLHSLKTFLNRNGLKIIDVEKINTHGGSIRVYIVHNSSKIETNITVQKILNEEIKSGINKFDTFIQFSNKVKNLKKNFSKNFEKISGKKIVFYGAPAKATTKLNYYNLEKNRFKAIEDNHLKNGKYIPGVNVKIENSKLISKEKPEVVIVLAWNFFDEIKKKIQQISNANVISILDLEKN